MKNRYAILLPLWLLLVNLTFAQSTEILPGLILPQMTTAQRTAMIDPANGLLVFDKTTQSYWYRQNDNWAELPKAGSTSNYWQLVGANGNEIQNTNTGGFWSKNPVGLNYNSSNTTNPPTAPINEAGTRLMWIPNRSAFRVGTITDAFIWAPDSIGLYSFATGYNVQANGYNAIAIGNSATASGVYSVAIGYQSTASGSHSMAIGEKNNVTGDGGIAIGYFNKASGKHSLATGDEATASGFISTAMGSSTIASGDYSMAMGNLTVASEFASLAMGDVTKSSGRGSTALNVNTRASGLASLSTGYVTTASGSKSTAMGSLVNTNSREGSFMIGDSDPNDEGETKVGTNDQFVARFKNGYYLLTSGDVNRTGASMLAGQTAWNAISDSTRKEKFVAANGEDFLTKLKGLRLGSWNYKNQKTTKPERFYGPMAQEIFAAFGKDTYGTIGTDTTVSTINLDGLLFIFSQTLEKRTADLQQENTQLKSTIETLKEESSAFKTIINQLDARLVSVESETSGEKAKTKNRQVRKDLGERR